MPVTLGAGALAALFAAATPTEWIAAAGWHLYLDQLSPLFAAPVGNGGRAAFAVLVGGLVAVVALIAGLLLLPREAKGNQVMTERVAGRAKRAVHRADDDAALDPADRMPALRRADAHPDAPPRAPIRAAVDLPVGGLDGAAFEPDVLHLDAVAAEPAAEMPLAGASEADAPLDLGSFAEPLPSETAPPPVVDDSLAGLVARFEAGLARRRANQVDAASDGAAIQTGAPPVADLALEAALNTLHRMTARHAGTAA